MRLDLDADIEAAWPAYKLWLERRVMLTELDHLSIDDVDAAYRALESWEAAS